MDCFQCFQVLVAFIISSSSMCTLELHCHPFIRRTALNLMKALQSLQHAHDDLQQSLQGQVLRTETQHLCSKTHALKPHNNSDSLSVLLLTSSQPSPCVVVADRSVYEAEKIEKHDHFQVSLLLLNTILLLSLCLCMYRCIYVCVYARMQHACVRAWAYMLCNWR